MKKYAIEVDNISKKYSLHSGPHYDTLRDRLTSILDKDNTKKIQKEFWALRDVSFKVEPGEVLGVIGRNGAGKSTLLKILSRITPPTRGSVTINGRVGSLLEVGTGFHQELTGRENIYLNGVILGMKRKEIAKKFDEIVDFSGVAKFLDTPVKFYSSGMMTRIGFSVAAFLEPEILLVDEVLSVGDAEFQRKSLGKIEDITKNQGRTVLFVSHNLSAIRSITDRAILFDGGRISKVGKTSDVADYYTNSILPKIADSNLATRKDRSGNGKVKLTKFYITDEHDNKTKNLESGKKYTFSFDYFCPSPRSTKNLDLGFNVGTRSGQSLFLMYLSFSGNLRKSVKSKGTFQFVIPKLPLAAGEYIVGARALVNGEEADYPNQVGTFTVLDGDYYQTGRVLEQRHSPMFIDGYWKD
jgi:lipopolysaccharide transport system ATP-binding protein